MKKLLFILLLLPLLATAQQPRQCKKCADPCSNCTQPAKESEKVIINNLPCCNQELKIDSGFQKSLTETIKDKGGPNVLDWVNSILQLALLILAYWAGRTAYKSLKATNDSLAATNKTLERDKKYRDLAFIADVDKLLIEQPELWAYEDTKRSPAKQQVTLTTPINLYLTGREKITFNVNSDFTITATDKDVSVVFGSGSRIVTNAGTTSTVQNVNATDQITVGTNAIINITSAGTISIQSLEDKILDDKIDAFCYYKLNNLELALNEHENDKDAKKCWEEYLVYIHDNSARFRDIIKNIRTTDYGNIYNKKFVDQITEILTRYKRI